MTVGLYSVSQFFDPEGRLLRNAPITVTEHGSNTEPDIYTDETGTTTRTEPLVTDPDGNLTFFVDTTNGWWKDLWNGPEYIGPVSVLELGPRANLVTTDTAQTITAPKTFDDAPVAFRHAGDAFDRVRLTADAILFGTGIAEVDVSMVRWPGGDLPPGQVGLYNDGATGAGGLIVRSGGAFGDGNNTWFGFVRDPVLNNWGMADAQANDLAVSAETTGRHIRFHAGTNWDGSNSQLAVGTDGVRANVALLAEAGLTVVGALALPAGSITSTMIADGTIQTADIATGQITSALIADGTIVDADISATAAIAASKIGAIPISQVTGLAAELATDEANIAGKVNKAGDTMTGSLTLTTTGNGALVWTDGSVAGFAASGGAYSSDAAVNDLVLRANTGRLLLQRGSGAAAVIVDSAGITAKQTILANAAVPIKLPSGAAGQVLTSDASGNLALAAPGAANPSQWTENDQSVAGPGCTIPMASGGVQQVTLTGNVTTAATVTGAAKGMVMVLRIKQDATGGRTWTWFTNVTWGPQGVPLLDTAASSQRTFTFEYDGTNWVEVSRTLSDTGWITPSFLNSWHNYGGTLAPAAYRRLGGVVYLRGMVSGGTSNGAVILNMPVGFRPAGDVGWPVMVSNFGAIGYLYLHGATSPTPGDLAIIIGTTTTGAELTGSFAL